MSEDVPEAVYVIAAFDHGPVKVGRSAVPSDRVRALQPGSPWKLLVWHAVWLPNHDEAVDFEGGVHSYLHSRRATREWFRISVHQAIGAVGFVDRNGFGRVRSRKDGQPYGAKLIEHDNPLVFLEVPPVPRKPAPRPDMSKKDIHEWLPARWIARMA